MPDRKPHKLIDPYLAGELDQTTADNVRTYLETTPRRRWFMAGIRAAVRGEHLATLPDVERSWQILAEKMRMQGEWLGIHPVVTSEESVRRRMWPSWRRGGRRILGRQSLWRGAWSLGAVATLITTFFVFRSGSSHISGTTRSYTTGVNQQGILTLDDGTRVTLAPQTTLQLVGFSKRVRTVSVDGKAYFEVVHATGAPFEVRSGPVTTRVLGTAFLVDHTPHSSHVRVAVEEGKVRVFVVARANTDFTVPAGYVGEITDSSTTVTAVADTAPGTEWLRGQLLFHHMPVATVLQTLSRWYGYQFRYADSLLPQRNVTISLSVRSPASALATLEQILRVNLTMTGDTITLTPQAEQRGKGIPKVRSYDVWTPTREVGR